MEMLPNSEAPWQNCSWSKGYWDGCCLYHIRDDTCSQASERCVYKDCVISLPLLHYFHLLTVVFWSHVLLFFAFCWLNKCLLSVIVLPLLMPATFLKVALILFLFAQDRSSPWLASPSHSPLFLLPVLFSWLSFREEIDFIYWANNVARV